MKECKYFCDRCGKELGIFSRQFIYLFYGERIEKDFCLKCYKKIIRFIDEKQKLEGEKQ